MEALIKKLKLPSGLSHVIFLNATDAFEELKLAITKTGIKVLDTPTGGQWQGLLAFVTRLEEIDAIAEDILPIGTGDAWCWIAYPKKSAKSYQSEISRDRGWTAIGNAGWEPVSQIALDENWSALRFRKLSYIKKLTRRKSMALSQEAKNRTSGN
jgi:hypothetical protein